MPLTDQEVSAMTPEQRQQKIAEIKAELARRNSPGNSPSNSTMAGMSTLPQKGFSMRGAILGGLRSLAGQPIEEKTSTADEINDFIAKERLKQQIASEAPLTPSEQEAKMRLDERKRQLAEQANQDETTPVVAGETIPTDVIAPVGKVGGKTPSYIKVPKGKNEYGVMQYDYKLSPESEREQKAAEVKATKTAEFDVKKEQLKKDLDSFFAVDNLIDRAEGGFLETRKAGLTSQMRAVAQPIDPLTGKADVKGIAARVHDAAVKRLRVQLVRAAGDVGNINIVEQQAAEKLIPSFYDSKESAKLKRAYLIEISKAISNKDANAVKAVLDQAGIGYVAIGVKTNKEIPNSQSQKIGRFTVEEQ